jgi:small subunit ribosomal protein S21
MKPGTQTKREGHPLQVLVRDNNIEQALRVLKKKMQREGVFREMRQRRSYEKPSERKNREKAEAIRRARKLARKKAQREGLLPDPRGKKLLPARALGQRAGTGDLAAPRRPLDHALARSGPSPATPASGPSGRRASVFFR